MITECCAALSIATTEIVESPSTTTEFTESFTVFTDLAITFESYKSSAKSAGFAEPFSTATELADISATAVFWSVDSSASVTDILCYSSAPYIVMSVKGEERFAARNESNDVVNSNAVVLDKNDSDETHSKVAKVDDDSNKNVKIQSSGRKKNKEEELLAEARAVCGAIDTSSGRSMRKRPEPPTAEDKKKPVARNSSKTSAGKPETKRRQKKEEEEEVSIWFNEKYNSKSESNMKSKPSEAIPEESKEVPAKEVEPAESVASDNEVTEEKENGTKEEATTAEAVNDTAAEEMETPAENPPITVEYTVGDCYK